LKSGALIIGLFLLAGGAAWWIASQGRPSRAAAQNDAPAASPQVDWATVNWDDPRLQNCGENSNCVVRRRWVEQIRSTNFKQVAKDAPIRKNCAGWAACLAEFPEDPEPKGKSKKEPEPAASTPGKKPSPGPTRACTLEAAMDLPASCPKGDTFCTNCKKTFDIADVNGPQ
jgi:hypothetical protein